MYDRILKRMQEKIRTRQYVMTLHAEEEMNNMRIPRHSVHPFRLIPSTDSDPFRPL